MRTPLSLRIARLLLVAASAGAFGVFAYIAVLARSFSVPLVVFLLAGVALAYAARSLGTDVRRGRLLALSGGLALAATGVLAGFGAGNVSLPMGALGILAAWAAVLHPPRRVAVIAFAVYVAIGLLLTLPRGPALAAFPWLVSSVVLWPWTSTLLLSAASLALPIYASIGLALALAISALLSPRGPVATRGPVAPAAPRSRFFVVRIATLALVAGALATAAYIAWAFARPQTSARLELDPVPLAVVFAGAALLALGIASLRALPPLGLASLAVGGTIAIVVLLGRPTVECYANGVATTGGPWWLPQTRSGSSSGSAGSGSGNAPGTSGSIGATVSTGVGGSSASSGEIRRGDGLVIRYRCSGNEVTEFTIERP